MSNGNTVTTIFRGESGQVINDTLSDENGPVNLFEWSVALTVWLDNQPPVIDAAPGTIAANQATTGKGKVSFAFDETTADLPAGNYNFRWTATNPYGKPFVFPKTVPPTNGTLVVQE